MLLAQGCRNTALSQMELCVCGGGRTVDIVSKRRRSEGCIVAPLKYAEQWSGLGKSLKSAVDPETIPVHQPLPEPLQLPCPGLLTLVVTKWLPVHMSFLVSFIKGYL